MSEHFDRPTLGCGAFGVSVFLPYSHPVGPLGVMEITLTAFILRSLRISASRWPRRARSGCAESNSAAERPLLLTEADDGFCV